MLPLHVLSVIRIISANRSKDCRYGTTCSQPVMTAADYLAWEAEQTGRHEFVGGETFAMAGAEDRHVTVVGNVYMALR